MKSLKTSCIHCFIQSFNQQRSFSPELKLVAFIVFVAIPFLIILQYLLHFRNHELSSLLTTTLFCSYQVFADFDCESSGTLSDSKCPSELKCIYDEAYEISSITSCQCRVVINTLSLPRNTLSYDLFRKVCSRHGDRLQELQLNDAELESIDSEIFRKYGNLKILNLAGNGLRVNFSEDAGGILELNLSGNGLVSLKSSNLNKLRFLIIANLSFNRLEDISGVFFDFQHLDELYLNDNQLTIVKNNDFQNLPNLRVLNLAHNSLLTFGNNLSLPNLQELYLNGNKLISLKRDDFTNLPNLRNLNLAHNLIRDIEGGFVARTTIITDNLEPLQQNPFAQWTINRKKLADAITGSNGFLNSPGIQNNFGDYLNRNVNFWLGVPRKRRQALESTTKPQNSGFFLYFGAPTTPKPSLQVSLSGKNTVMSSFSWLKLQVLNLAENRIREISQEFLGNLPELQSLNVSYNDLTRFDFNQLNSSSKLTSLDVRGNRFLSGLDVKLLKARWSFLKIIDVDLSLA